MICLPIVALRFTEYDEDREHEGVSLRVAAQPRILVGGSPSESSLGWEAEGKARVCKVFCCPWRTRHFFKDAEKFQKKGAL